MHYTNKYRIPAEVVSAIIRDPYHNPGRISVTSLINSPRIHQLGKRHQDEIVQDVSERLFALYGQIAHGILDRADDYEAFHEERLSVTVKGWQVTGQTDLFKRKADGRHILRDYKFTSVYVSNFDLKPEWVAQVNLYALLWREHNFAVDQAQIVALYRDWRRMEAERRQSYPPPVQIFEVPLRNQDAAWHYLNHRVFLHQNAEELPDELLPHCTPEEQWRREEKWAVMKKGRKTAVRVLDNEDTALQLAESLKGGYVQHRPALPTRCLYFCQVQDFCNQFQEEKETIDVPESNEEAG